MQRQQYVVGFAFSADQEEIILVRKKRPNWQVGKLNGPGGKFEADKDADLYACMVREFEEETDVRTETSDWHYYAKAPGLDGDVHFFYMIDDKALMARTKTDEEIEIVAVDYAFLQQEGLANLAWLIGMALDENRGKFFAEITYNQEYKTGRFYSNAPQP